MAFIVGLSSFSCLFPTRTAPADDILQVLTSPAREYSVRSADDVVGSHPLAPMVFTGQVEIGGAEVQLERTAQGIHKQILAINPDFDPYNFGSCAKEQEAKGISHSESHRRLHDNKLQSYAMLLHFVLPEGTAVRIARRCPVLAGKIPFPPCC